jgi:hypothetical protein
VNGVDAPVHSIANRNGQEQINFQAPFRAFSLALPPIIRDMGVLANYTYVDSRADYTFFGNTVRERLIGRPVQRPV